MHDDIISLNPDMSKIWGQVLRGLRESGETMLHAAVIDLQDIYFTADTIEITCKDGALYTLLNKHKDKLEQYAGKGCICIQRETKTKAADKEVIAKLESLFGDKLQVVAK